MKKLEMAICAANCVVKNGGKTTSKKQLKKSAQCFWNRTLSNAEAEEFLDFVAAEYNCAIEIEDNTGNAFINGISLTGISDRFPVGKTSSPIWRNSMQVYVNKSDAELLQFAKAILEYAQTDAEPLPIMEQYTFQHTSGKPTAHVTVDLQTDADGCLNIIRDITVDGDLDELAERIVVDAGSQ